MFLKELEESLNIDVSQHVTILTEANKALDMFSDEFFKMLDDTQKVVSGSNKFNNHEQHIKSSIRDFQTKFKKQDRVLWLTRQLKLFWLGSLVKRVRFFNANKEEAEKILEFVEKEVKKLNKKLGGNTLTVTNNRLLINRDDIPHINDILDHFDHFYSLDIHAINSYNFTGKESFEEIKNIFNEYEKKWQETTKRMIPEEYTEDAEIFLKINNNLAWWDLGKESCEIEGEAMGHCGNTASARSGETILSLREKVIIKNRVFYKPQATFILQTRTGTLGEMKGPYNEKPSSEYHPAIIELILDDRIEKIKGGGYIPENNFSLNDLDQDEQEYILEQKPDLFTLRELLVANEYEMNDIVSDKIKDHYGEEWDGYSLLLKTYEDIDDFISSERTFFNSNFLEAYEIVTGGGGFDVEDIKITDEDIKDALLPLDKTIKEYMDRNYQKEVLRYAGDWFVAWKITHQDDYERVLDSFKNNINYFKNVNLKDELENILRRIIDIDYNEFDSMYDDIPFTIHINKIDENNYLNSKDIGVYWEQYGENGLTDVIIADIELEHLQEHGIDIYENVFYDEFKLTSPPENFADLKDIDFTSFRGDVRIIISDYDR